MLYSELFGPWGRILLVGIGASALLSVLILITCLLTRGCIGSKCLRRYRQSTDNNALSVKQVELKDNGKLGDVSYRSWRLGSLYDSSSICEKGEVSSKDSLSSSYTHLDNKDSVIIEKSKSDVKKIDNFPTELTLSLQFLPLCDEPKSHRGKFVIGIEAISGLPPKQYNSTIEPYVIVEIIKQFWTQRKRHLLHSFRTRSIRHTTSPVYRETFVIADVNSYEAKEWTLVITAYDHDRYANHTELSFIKIPMKEVKKIFCSPEIHLFNYKMKQSAQEFGNILLGICYLPTAQRLTITVVKLRDVKYPATNIKKINFNPYVRVLMLNSKTGRKMKKKKTKVIQSSYQLEFNETFTFDISFYHLDTVQFLIVLCNKVDEVLAHDHQSDSEDSINSLNKDNDILIGKIALGKGVRGAAERIHWFSMLQNPRKVVNVWHTLK